VILTLGYTQPDEESSVITLSSADIEVTCVDKAISGDERRVATYSYRVRTGDVINLK